MKAIILFILFIMLTIPTVFGQIKIGDNPQNIDPASVLELESTSKVLVITRVSTLEMEAITPQRGGIVYNIDTECINYYDGTQWVNLCDAVNFTITNDPIINNRATIEITQTASGYNLEVAKNGILGDNIVDGGIGPDDIQDNSITQDKLAAESVGSSEIRQNAVGSDEIRDGSIAPSDIANFIPGQVLTTDENGIVQWEDGGNLMGSVGDEITITGSGTPASPLEISEGIQLNISNNNTLITDHLVADTDTDATNELIDLDFDKTTNTLSISQSANPIGASVNLEALVGSDDQQLTFAGNVLTLEEGGIPIDFNSFATDNELNTGLALKEDLANKDANPTLGTSDIAYPTQNAVKTYVDSQVGGISTDDDITSATLSNTSLLRINEGTSFVEVSLTNLEESQAILNETERATLAETNNATAITTIQNDKEDIANKSDVTTLGNSTTLYPTQNAVKVYVDTELALVSAGSGTTELADQATITGDGSNGNEFRVADAGITPIKIQPSAITGQYLSTDALGNVVWNNLPATGTTELADQVTIVGTGATGSEFTVADAGITPIKIQPSAITGQYLSTDALGNV
ncbi:MAG: hypothetical protein V7692_17180, partial [Maribacter arcticus]